MKIGILGTRGIPNAYGGFEQFAQYLAHGLTIKGHQVSVYNSTNHPYKKSEWEGVRIIHCKDWEENIGTTGQFIFDFNCIQNARRRGFDILLQLGYTSNSVWHNLWPKKAINVINLDGLEWKRSKYSKQTQKFLLVAEKLAVRNGDVLVSDSIGIQKYIHRKYHRTSHYIPYGAEVFTSPEPEAIEPLNVKPYEYMLLIARMEPENNIETIIKGYLLSESPDPLIVVGNPDNKFGRYLQKNYTDARIRFAGSIYDFKLLNNLRYFSKIYFHGHSVGGTNPSLLEAMACHCNIIAHNNIFNVAILGDNGTYFLTDADIKTAIALGQDPTIRKANGDKNVEKIQKTYSWSTIIDQYEQVFLNAIKDRAAAQR
jgi:glycosyltransferase involved in cell wall biosynthesis